MADRVAGLLQRLFDRALDGLVVMRASDGLIVLVNEAFGRLLGLPVKGIVGHNSAEFGLWPAPAQRGGAAVRARRRRAAGGGVPAGGRRGTEHFADH